VSDANLCRPQSILASAYTYATFPEKHIADVVNSRYNPPIDGVENLKSFNVHAMIGKNAELDQEKLDKAMEVYKTSVQKWAERSKTQPTNILASGHLRTKKFFRMPWIVQSTPS